ncbi:MAG: hypothetical protein C0602_11290 [Denitrovibrio sp.]|nr:MAG: hypothetical protein C0602_11290 [Denitrovibrio sp.]
MRVLIFTILLSLSMILVSCGSSGGSSGSSAREASISLNVDFEDARSTDTSFFVSNTEIDSVELTYTNNADSSGKMDITSAAEGGTIQLTQLTIDSTYIFTVKAFGTDGSEACSGTASIAIVPEIENEVDLECTFTD